MKAVAHRSYFLPAMTALVTLAWVMLWIWDRSPYGRYLKHDQLAELDLQSGILVPAMLYTAGWTPMTVAMMLPTSLEKNTPWGRKLSAPLGISLLAWGTLIVINHTWSWQG